MYRGRSSRDIARADGVYFRLKALMHQIRAASIPCTTLIAAESIFQDNAAPLVQLTSPQTCRGMSSLSEDVAFVGPRAR